MTVLKHELVLSRHDGRLIVLTPDGRSIWGTADAAFALGLPEAQPAAKGASENPSAFVGVPPIDELVGRRPAADALPAGKDAARPHGRVLRRRPAPPRRPGPGRPEERRLTRILFPDGEPPLPDGLQECYDRMDLRFAIGVLMGNRDLARRLAAEAGVPVAG